MNFSLKRSLFKSRLSQSAKKEEQWKDPDFDSEIKYKGKTLPKAIYIYELVSEKDFKYIGNNEYVFDSEKVNLDDNYKLVQLLSHNCIESFGNIVRETKYEKDYIEYCNNYNSITSKAEYFYDNNDKNKAVQISDKLFFDTIDYCEAFKKEHENEYIEDDFDIELDD